LSDTKNTWNEKKLRIETNKKLKILAYEKDDEIHENKALQYLKISILFL